MEKPISDEINKYVSLLPPMKATTLQELNKARQQREKDISDKFEGVLMRGTKIPNAHSLLEITFTRHYDGDVSTYNLTKDESEYFSFGVFDNMKRISKADLTPEEKTVYDAYNLRMNPISTQSDKLI